MEMTDKQKRVAILKKMNEWNKARCANCHEEMEGNSNTAIKCTCEAAVAVRKLGVEYEEGAKLRRQGRVAELLKTFKQNPLSVDTYDMLKELEVDDKVIMRNIKITNAEFREWKCSVGRAKRPINETHEQQQKREEYAKWLNVAIQNGVRPGTFRQRVIDYEIPYEEAVVLGRVRRVHSKTKEKVGAK